jgi:hypothetical protein
MHFDNFKGINNPNEFAENAKTSGPPPPDVNHYGAVQNERQRRDGFRWKFGVKQQSHSSTLEEWKKKNNVLPQRGVFAIFPQLNSFEWSRSGHMIEEFRRNFHRNLEETFT